MSVYNVCIPFVSRMVLVVNTQFLRKHLPSFARVRVKAVRYSGAVHHTLGAGFTKVSCTTAVHKEVRTEKLDKKPCSVFFQAFKHSPFSHYVVDFYETISNTVYSYQVCTAVISISAVT